MPRVFWELAIKIDGSRDVETEALCTEVSWHESINEAPTGRLVLTMGTRKEGDLVVEKSIGQEITVELYGDDTLAYTLVGEVHDVQYFGRADVGVRAVVVFRHKLHRLRQTAQCKIWATGDYNEHKTTDVVRNVLQSAGLSVTDVDSSELSHLAFMQFNETDFNFVQRLVEEMGMWMVFSHESPSELSIKSSTGSTTDIAAEHLLDWTVSSETTPNELDVSAASIPTETRVGTIMENATLSSSPGKTAYGALKIAGFDTGPENKANAKIAAEAQLYSLASSGLRFEGTIANQCVFAGDVVNLKTEAVHEASKILGDVFVTDATVRFTAEGLRTTIRGYNSGNQVRPPRKAIIPRIDGVSVAVVTTSEGSTMENGRVRVKFPWFEDEISPWARVAQSWAGTERGAFFLPRIDDEVLVAFEQGDPNRPVVVGSLHNSKAKPPVALPDEWTKSIIRTIKNHHLVFEDKDGEEFVEILTGLENHNLRFDDQNKAVTMKSGAGHTLHFDDEGKTIELHSTGGLEVTMDDNGQSVTIKALQTMTLECGNSKIELKPDGITIKGLKVDVTADTMATVKGATAEVNGSAQLTLKGGVTMIN